MRMWDCQKYGVQLISCCEPSLQFHSGQVFPWQWQLGSCPPLEQAGTQKGAGAPTRTADICYGFHQHIWNFIMSKKIVFSSYLNWSFIPSSKQGPYTALNADELVVHLENQVRDIKGKQSSMGKPGLDCSSRGCVHWFLRAQVGRATFTNQSEQLRFMRNHGPHWPSQFH